MVEAPALRQQNQPPPTAQPGSSSVLLRFLESDKMCSQMQQQESQATHPKLRKLHQGTEDGMAWAIDLVEGAERRGSSGI